MDNLPLLQASRLTKHYYKRSFWFQKKKIATTPLNNVSFSIPRHKILGLIGESGSGKTTLALGLAGPQLHEQGIVWKFGLIERL